MSRPEVESSGPRRFILFTLAIPLLAFLGLWLTARVGCSADHTQRQRVQQSALDLISADGASLQAQLTAPQQTEVAVLLVGDRALDENWNSGAVRAAAAERLALALGEEYGAASLRFAGRASAGSRASRESYHDLDLAIADIAAAWRALHMRFPEARKTLLAHGEGCALSLAALGKMQTHDLPLRLALSSCWLSDTMLDLWGERLLWNLQRSGASQEVLRRASETWRTFRMRWPHGQLPDDRATPADLQIFLAALRELQSPGWENFRQQSTQLRPRLLLADYGRRNGRWRFFPGEFDEELPEQQRLAASAIASCRPETLRGADHFLLETDRRREGLPLAWQRWRSNRGLASDVSRLTAWLSFQDDRQ